MYHVLDLLRGALHDGGVTLVAMTFIYDTVVTSVIGDLLVVFVTAFTTFGVLITVLLLMTFVDPGDYGD